MFKVDKNSMRVFFTVGERDLAMALAEMEGYVVVDWLGTMRAEPLPVFFDELQNGGRRVPGTQPEQVSPGVYSYRIRLRTRTKVLLSSKALRVSRNTRSIESASNA